MRRKLVNKRNGLPDESDDPRNKDTTKLITYVERTVLTRQQINKCWMDIEDTHPLREKVDLHHISPILTRCFQSKKKDFQFKLRQAMLNELGVKMPKSDGEIQEDPFLILGYGVNAFFDILLSLCMMFCAISIVCIPIFIVYSKMGQSTYSDE
jgi:hypothetical protein